MTGRALAAGGAVAVVLGLGLGLAVRGGADEKTEQETLEEALASIEEELEEVGPIVGLGEAAPPRPDEWRTDFSKHLVPLAEIGSGGPPKDGIPAIDEPKFERATDVD